ncbi:STAS domain-containing protein [uncultured Cellulomonas sp.]|uniref:STAS domain-containing protein n=1 Tax=uncultured Cellulomonas sp. TaxID=189682 RepID=UPI0026195FE1|nr:STAS domain-containing protein [uncultured Cellulomonas sp.]
MAADTRPGRSAASWYDAAADRAPDPHGGVEIRTADGVTVVRFWGSVDLAVRATGTDGLGDLRGDSGPMTVDCRDVVFMDSTGLSVLVRLVRDAVADGRAVTFLGAGQQVLELLRTTGVDLWMSKLGVDGVPTGS